MHSIAKLFHPDSFNFNSLFFCKKSACKFLLILYSVLLILFVLGLSEDHSNSKYDMIHVHQQNYAQIFLRKKHKT